MEPKNNLQLVKTTFPIKCCICGYIASGFIYYNVKCCDGCKHFFRRCVNAKELFKCKFDGNCDVMAVPKKCKSCRFDKCILSGMNIRKLQNSQQSKSIWELRSVIEQRLGELALKGKYCVKKRNENYNNTEEINFSFMVNISFIFWQMGMGSKRYLQVEILCLIFSGEG
uniref:Nuclear receptor domain-containing protein n=1 Tax=Meloidogyne enterolobii TaxID=390850 RepID=A0A6V7TJD1_MELEN|nr:unnamed protein product [Meloidogyne enterolobii]